MKYCFVAVMMSFLLLMGCGDSKETAGPKLHKACTTGDLEAVKSALASHPDLINTPDEEGSPPLNKAAAGGHVEIVKFLLAKGADVKAKTKKGHTPLQSAMFIVPTQGKRPSVEVMKILLDAGANPNDKDEVGMTILMWAAMAPDVNIVKLFLEKKADINLKCNDSHGGKTALHCATGIQNTEIVELLVDKGADMSIKDSEGQTPLTAALNYKKDPATSPTYNFDAVIELLRKRGAPE
ncbi:MAG TPA: ankyrin repeat domain-containing protein [Planctomycetota bacterium]|nr:ankyrin repeat domain-containing protein [Planctomycetota bacterium]